MHTKALPYVGLLGLLWGTNLVIMRVGVGQFDPMVFVGVRLLLASLAFVVVYTLSGNRLVPTNRKLWLYATFLGIVSTAIPMTAIVTSLTFQSSGVTALLITTAPAFITIAAHFFLPDEQMSARKLFGVLLALSGAALIVLRGESGLPNVAQGSPIGYGLVLSAMLFETAGTILIRRQMQKFSSFDVTAVRLTVAGLTVMPVALLLRGFDLSAVTGSGWFSLVYAAFIGAFTAQMLAFNITKRFGATAFSLTSYVVPVVAAITGVLWLDETITVWMVAGMVLIGAGILLINGRRSVKLMPNP
ncbi:MAG: DMT family transporter [Anaerolineales bacterium]|nr:DMT family transporter [Anaerolineales bacterium]MCB8938200.1 DMT family transporter [Ardenticatenaceae bacterium]